MPKTVLPLAKVFGGRDLYLPREQWLRHFVMFSPTGSGKSETFFRRMISRILKRSACFVYDPKGELFEQTGNSARRDFVNEMTLFLAPHFHQKIIILTV